MIRFALSLILALTLAVTASAGHGIRQQVVVQRQRVVVQRVVVPRQRVVVQQFVQPHHVQQFRVQQFVQPHVQQFVVPQQFSNGCHNDGVLQFSGGCQSLFR